MSTPVDTRPHMVAPGPSVRLASLEGLAKEFGIRDCDALELCERLDVPLIKVPSPQGDRDFVNIHALETALFTVTDPKTPIECMAMIAEMFAGVRRQALINQLRYVGHHLFSSIRQRKCRREQSCRGRGRPIGSRDRKPRKRRTKTQVVDEAPASLEVIAPAIRPPVPSELLA